MRKTFFNLKWSQLRVKFFLLISQEGYQINQNLMLISKTLTYLGAKNAPEKS